VVESGMLKPCPLCGIPFVDIKGVTYCSFTCALWSRIDVRAADECWPWSGGVSGGGYGISSHHTGAHVEVYEMLHGPVPEGKRVCHHCDNPPCCNPSHLWTGTALDNSRDAVLKGRMSRGEKRHNTKLTEEHIKIIRSMPFEIITKKDVAQILGCSKATVGRIVKREVWNHVV
jgi:hypothetical protein